MPATSHAKISSAGNSLLEMAGESVHALATHPIPQDNPRVITSYFESIPSLMNGEGPNPTRGPLGREITEYPPSRPSVPLALPEGTLLRREDFGSILFNARKGGVAFLNRPATELVIRPDATNKEADKLASELDAVFIDRISPGPARIVSYDYSLVDAFNYPISATMELTYSCHHSCKHCMYASGPGFNRTQELSLDQWASTLEDMSSRGLCSLYFSGGEIVRYEGYQHLLSLCDALGLTYLIVSDLAGHSDRDFEVFAAAKNLSSVMVSLDGHDESSHDFLRGTGAFAKTLAGIKRLMGLKVPVGVYHTVHSSNLQSVPRMIDFVNELGITTLVTGVACPIGRAKSALKDQTLNDDGCMELTRHYLGAIASGKIVPLNSGWTTLADRYKRTGRCDNVFSTWRDFAHLGTHRVHLSPTGEIRLCPKLQGTQYSSFGNVREMGIDEAWRGAQMTELRQKAVLENLILGAPYTDF